MQSNLRITARLWHFGVVLVLLSLVSLSCADPSQEQRQEPISEEGKETVPSKEKPVPKKPETTSMATEPVDHVTTQFGRAVRERIEQVVAYIPVSIRKPLTAFTKGFSSCAAFGFGLPHFAAHYSNVVASLTETIVAVQKESFWFCAGSAAAELMCYSFLMLHMYNWKSSDKAFVNSSLGWVLLIAAVAVPLVVVDAGALVCVLLRAPKEAAFSAIVIGKMLVRPVFNAIVMWVVKFHAPKAWGMFAGYVADAAERADASDAAYAALGVCIAFAVFVYFTKDTNDDDDVFVAPSTPVKELKETQF